MSYKEDLDFAMNITKNSGYGTVQILDSISYGKFINDLKYTISKKDISFLSNFNITSKVKKSIFKFGKGLYILTLDCDSVADLKEAEEELCHQKISYCVIESSPDRFWIVCDFFGDARKNCRKAESIPGVDKRYLESCALKNKFNLRAYPKGGFIPRFENTIEISGASDEFKRWLQNFKDYWQSNDIKMIASQQIVYELTANERIEQIARRASDQPLQNTVREIQRVIEETAIEIVRKQGGDLFKDDHPLIVGHPLDRFEV